MSSSIIAAIVFGHLFRRSITSCRSLLDDDTAGGKNNSHNLHTSTGLKKRSRFQGRMILNS